MAIINSNQIAFVDITDSRKLDVYISSNLPITQIFNSNTQTYSPDWRTTNLKLTADVYLDSEHITPDKVEWFMRTGVGSTETLVSTDIALTIATNKLSESPIITYKCRAEYQNITSFQEITFTRVDTGLHGSDGHSAPAVQAQYSVDGNVWSSTLDSNTHKYIRFSYDNGAIWTTAIKMAGEDGTSVTITGTAYYNGTLSDGHIGRNVVLYSDTSFTTVVNTSNLNTGDAYIVQGYLCVYNKVSNAFICTGMIQGPRGTAGTSSYIFIRYATDANGANISDNPSGKSYIGFYTSSVNSAPTDVRLYTWRKFVGDNAKNIILSGNSQVFKVSKTNTITPATITVTAQVVNTTIPDSGWTYSVNGGQTFLSTVPTGVSRNGNIVTITGSTIASNSIVIKASDGTVEDVFTVYKAIDGSDGGKGQDGAPAPIAFLTNENVTFSANAQGQILGTAITSNVVAYNGTTKVTPTIGTISGVPTGMTITQSTITASNEIMLTLTIANNSTLGSALNNMGVISIPVTSPVSTVLSLTWSKVNSGAIGAGIKSTTVTYGVSDSATTKPADTAWQATIPTVADGKYLWTRTIIDYTDDSIADTVSYVYAKQGTKGDTGAAGSAVTVSSIQYQAGASATIAPMSIWSDSVVAVTEGMYLWTKTTFSDGKIAYGVAKQGVSGKDGVGINSITVDYGVSDSATVQPTAWQQNIPVVAEGKYLWTRTVTDYTDASKADTVAYIYAKQGAKGDTGTAGSSVTVKSIKYQAGTSATTAPTGTWSDSVVAVAAGGYLWTQTTFSDNKVAYGVAKQGEKGDQGIQGPKGNDGQQYYTWVKYADTPTSGMSNDPAGKTYIGLAYNKTTATESTTYSDYAWSLIRGATGAVGPKGADGQQYYTWIKYADNASGANMSDLPDGKLYIGLAYNKTTSTESNVASDYTWALFKGDKGDAGRGVSKVTEYYLATTASSGVTTSTSGWTTTIQTIDATKKYLWNYEVITYTDNATSATSPIIIGVFGNTGSTGATGKGIKSVTEHYLATASSSGVTTATSGWTTTLQALTSTKKYLWNYEIITYTDNTTTTINPVIIGVYGDQGTPAISVMLSSEAHLFEADSRGVPVVTSITLNVIGYQGLTQSATTVGTITGLPSSGMTATILNNGATNTQIQIAVTETLTSVDSGILTIPVTVNGKVVNKQFSWTKSKEGLTGEQGSDAITFQVYSADGYVLSKDTPSITLQTFAYNGSVPIEAGATYQWYKYTSGNWVAITDATNRYLDITHSDVSFSGSYMCKMLFNSAEYVDVATIDDKNDVNAVFTSKPSSYSAGDIWIVSADYAPNGIVTGTLLRAEHTNSNYSDSDWVTATKYDAMLKDIKEDLDVYNQYFSFDSQDGLKISARDENGVESKFSTSLTNEQLAFNYGDEAIAYINGTSMHIKEAEIESPLTVTGKYSGGTMLQAPIINIGNFSIVVESNGSLSIVSNT